MTITAEMFREATGCEPRNDDLDRCNCCLVGTFGHLECGWNATTGRPRWMPAAALRPQAVPLLQYSPEARIEMGEVIPGPAYFAMDPASEKGDRTNFVWFGDGAAEVAELTEKLRCSENVRYNLAGRVKELEAGIPTVDVARLTGERDAWTESARYFSASADYYRGIVDQIGCLFGIAARTSDDGSIQDSVLRAKVFELVKEGFAAKDARIAELDSELASRPEPVSVPDTPRHNPFREFPASRR